MKFDEVGIMKSMHGMLDTVALKPVSDMAIEELSKYNLTFDDVEQAYEILDARPEHLFIDPNGSFYPFCYWDGLYYYMFLSISPKALRAFDDEKFNEDYMFKKKREQIRQWLKEEQWLKLIRVCDKKISFHLFHVFQDKLDPKDRKEIFLEVYCRNEYGFNQLNQDMIRGILMEPHSKRFDVSISTVKPDTEGYYTIYRGQTHKSSPVDQAYSWTLDINVARFFANRFNSFGEVLTRKVHANDIRGYINSRNEEEVIVFPEDVK